MKLFWRLWEGRSRATERAVREWKGVMVRQGQRMLQAKRGKSGRVRRGRCDRAEGGLGAEAQVGGDG